ncbi:aminotransferase class I/II-fold pyridoxal phosphate-dependent enzyme [Bradyrhizobium yuanmingense]|uniref:aminotransferase class I/II-fold pyridoxal phosphate-dependent enzyme n=1 Tax=Bradyrhizobium yuanmingense TaxID=108015 RepID=UPI001F0A6862|nr:aminotransferase class I/II-fold pyridoxal phosphate-dependent enzyme [Bradyrhizobium yuanmingense]
MVAYVCDGVYSMGNCSPIRELRQLQERYEVFLYIDDGHGISVCGRRGEGFARTQFPPLLGERTIVAASLENGFGASGGILMLGTAHQEALFRRHFIPGALKAAISAALGSCRIHRSAELGQRQGRLSQRVDLFDRRIETAGLGNSLPIRVIVVGSEINAITIARRLRHGGFNALVTSFPTVEQRKSGIRVCITAEHEAPDIERLCD